MSYKHVFSSRCEKQLLLCVEYFLFAVAFVLCAYLADTKVCAVYAQKQAAHLRGRQAATKRITVPTSPDDDSFAWSVEPVMESGRVIGRMEIPDLGVSTAMLGSDTKEDLLRGAGHIPGTALPGGLGTAALAGHRDTFFRRLERVKTGMQVLVSTEAGVYRYQVYATEVVDPAQVEVLAMTNRPELSLVTCFPFRYIGSAPMRFIVHAQLLSVAAEAK